MTSKAILPATLETGAGCDPPTSPDRIGGLTRCQSAASTTSSWREILPHLKAMGSALGRQLARIELKAGHVEDAKLRIGMTSQKRSEHFQGNTLGTPNRDVRMKRLEIRLQTCMEDCILNTAMQGKKMRMSLSHTCPNDR